MRHHRLLTVEINSALHATLLKAGWVETTHDHENNTVNLIKEKN